MPHSRWGGGVFLDWNHLCGQSSYAGKFAISEAYKQETEWLCDTVDELLEYMVGTDRLRDVITQVKCGSVRI